MRHDRRVPDTSGHARWGDVPGRRPCDGWSGAGLSSSPTATSPPIGGCVAENADGSCDGCSCGPCCSRMPVARCDASSPFWCRCDVENDADGCDACCSFVSWRGCCSGDANVGGSSCGSSGSSGFGACWTCVRCSGDANVGGSSCGSSGFGFGFGACCFSDRCYVVASGDDFCDAICVGSFS